MKTDLYKIEDIVKKVLIEHKDTRNDNFILIYRVYKEINEPAMIRELFCEIMLNHSLYGLPSFESIVRSRRKVFEKHPELNPKRIKELRRKQEQKYRLYASNSK